MSDYLIKYFNAYRVDQKIIDLPDNIDMSDVTLYYDGFDIAKIVGNEIISTCDFEWIIKGIYLKGNELTIDFTKKQISKIGIKYKLKATN